MQYLGVQHEEIQPLKDQTGRKGKQSWEKKEASRLKNIYISLEVKSGEQHSLEILGSLE